MQLTTEEQLQLTEIVKKSGGNIQTAVMLAYEHGLITGALRTAQKLGQEALNQHQQGSGGGDDEADDAGPLTASDRAALQRLGIDTTRKYRHKNSTLTVTGYKPSRWKYPVSLVNQNGRRLKCSVDFIKTQCRVI